MALSDSVSGFLVCRDSNAPAEVQRDDRSVSDRRSRHPQRAESCGVSSVIVVLDKQTDV